MMFGVEPESRDKCAVLALMPIRPLLLTVTPPPRLKLPPVTTTPVRALAVIELFERLTTELLEVMPKLPLFCTVMLKRLTLGELAIAIPWPPLNVNDAPNTIPCDDVMTITCESACVV